MTYDLSDQACAGGQRKKSRDTANAGHLGRGSAGQIAYQLFLGLLFQETQLRADSGGGRSLAGPVPLSSGACRPVMARMAS